MMLDDTPNAGSNKPRTSDTSVFETLRQSACDIHQDRDVLYCPDKTSLSANVEDTVESLWEPIHTMCRPQSNTNLWLAVDEPRFVSPYTSLNNH